MHAAQYTTTPISWALIAALRGEEGHTPRDVASAVSQSAAQTPGMERREDRRDERSGVVNQPATTGSTAPTPAGPK
jgi:hypothetical protein